MDVKLWARKLKREVIALWIAARDVRVPLIAKIIAGTTAAYALSPIDLIPDFIPILGYLDDLLIVPAGIWLALRLIPAFLMEEFRLTASQKQDRPVSRLAAACVICMWAICAYLVWQFHWP